MKRHYLQHTTTCLQIGEKVASIASIIAYCWAKILKSCRVTSLRYPSWKLPQKSRNFTLSTGTFPKVAPDNNPGRKDIQRIWLNFYGDAFETFKETR